MATADQKTAFLSQMGLERTGVRKGSILIPLAALVLALLGFLLHGLEDGRTVLKEGFAERCTAAKGSKHVSASRNGLREACVEGTAPIEVMTQAFASKGFNEKFDTLTAFTTGKQKIDGVEVASEFEKARALKGSAAVTGTWREVLGFVNAFLADLVGDFRDIIASTAQTAGMAAAFAIIPGLAGLVYRRNFLGWFLVPFAGLLALISSGVLPLPVAVSRMPESGATLAFLTGQIVLVLLAFRLRRHSNSFQALGAGLISPTVHNNVLFYVLVGLGILCVLHEPAGLWSALGIESFLYKTEFLVLGLPLLYTLLRRSQLALDGKSAKNIVVCLDGTSNTPDQEERGLSAQTNVFKLFTMLKPDDASGIVPHGTFDASITKRYGDKQFALYYTGVGNKFETSIIGQVVGGATGMGASEIVQRAYLDVMRLYKPGDRIFIFGFSRGAAIARMLANSIDQKGAPRTVWTLRLFGRHWQLYTSRARRGQERHVPIAVLGCWDTVGAFGIAKKIGGIDFQKIDLFKDLSVPDNVEQAYHMVALDERRQEFAPTLMEPDPIKPERIVEVWFCGDHANIGGGWGTPKLSDVTFDFLLKHVSSGYAHAPGMVPGNEAWGLYLSAYDALRVAPGHDWPGSAVAIGPDPLGQLRQWNSRLYQYEARELPLHAVISETVFQRMTQSQPVYAPQALFSLNEALEKKRNTVANEIARLSATRSLSSEESVAIMAFKEKLRLMRWPQHVDELDADRKERARPPTEHPAMMLANPGHAVAPRTWGPIVPLAPVAGAATAPPRALRAAVPEPLVTAA